MKCTRCQHDSKYKDRSGGKCPSCGVAFAFEPREGAPFTDGAFLHAIEAVSGKGTVRFLPQHVRWQLEKQRKTGKVPKALGVVAILLGLVSGIAQFAAGDAGPGLLLLLVGGAVGVLLLILGFRRPAVASISSESFTTMWSRWTAVFGDPQGLIQPRRALAARSAALDEELEHYSFDRAVICDRRELVDVLLQNRFHFENNCAVLSFGGYPEAAFPIVRRMLRNNPRLLVLAVHDASHFGCYMAHRLANEPEWFKDHGRVVDVGLRPAHAKFFRGQLEQLASPVTVEAGLGITEREAAWLRRYRIDALAIRPEQLIKRLYRALTEAEKTVAGDDPDVVYLGIDSDTSDGGSDSFG